jgi:hypothetical protein
MLHVHKVVLEEVLQLSLGGRVGEVSNVQSPTLSGAGDNGLVLGRVDRLVTAGANGGALGGGSGLGKGGVCHLGGGSFDGHDDGGSGGWMSWWKACWSACERCFGVDYLSRPPCGGNGIGESWLGSYVPKILLSVMVKVVVIELTVVDDER